MGVDLPGFKYIIDHKNYIKGDVLHIGRQGLHYAGPYADKTGLRAIISNSILRANGLNFTAEDTVNGGDGHTEKLYKLLGASSVDSLDYSPYERATIIHDLNEPVPEHLHNKYDYILDAGTFEHIFDVKTVITNIKKMLKVNGVVVFISPANNFLGHGFYQFSPEFFRTVFSVEAGFKINSLQLVELVGEFEFKMIDLPEPGYGARQEITTNGNQYYICAVAEKVEDVDNKEYQQSDYIAIWDHNK